MKVCFSVGGLGICGAPVGHHDGGFLGQEVRALSFDGFADQRLFRVDIAAVDHFLQKFKAGAHIVAVFGLTPVQCVNFRLGIPAVVQVRVGLGQHEGLQPPAVGAHGGLNAVLLKHPAALQKFLRRLRQGQLVLVEHILVYEKAVGHDFLGNCHQLSVHGIGGLDNVTQILDAVQAG